MAEVAKGIIDIEINTGSAASQLQALQTQINAFNLALNKSNKAQGTFAAEYSKELQGAINKTGLFTAETVRLSTAASTLDKTLSKGKTSLGQFFSAKFNKDSAIAAETMALAAERAKRLQTQFIATSGAAGGFQEAIAVRPLAAFSSEAAVAAQRTQILSNMFKQGTTQLINFGKNVQWAGRQLMVGFTVPLTIFGGVAGKTFMELEKQVVGFKKVYGDMFTTPAELNKNLEAIKGLAGEYTKYGIAVKDTIGLAAEAAAAGRQGTELTDAVTQATRLATLGQMDQNAALETTISLQSAFKLSGQDLADTINFLNMVENQTVVTLQDIANAIPRVAPVIAGLGGDVKDLTVFLAAMQEGGVNANEGANALKSGLASLINPTRQATEMLSGFGINLETIIQANKGDLMGTVTAFSQALAGLDQFSRQQALEQVFGKFQYAKLGALFDNITRKGSQAQQVIATMGYTTEQLGATADKELKTIEESFGVQLTGAVERFKLAIAPIGQLFVQLAIPVVNFITKIVEGFNNLSDGQKRFAAIATVIVGVVVPAVTMLAGLFLNLVGTLAKMTQGMALFSKGFITGGPIGAFKALSQSSKYLSLAEMDAAMAAQQLSGASQVLNTTLMQQVGTANAAAAAIANLTRAYGAMAATQSAAGGLPSFGVASAAGTNAAQGAKTGGIRIRGIRRNAGGGVPGVGNTDTVPAMLTPGEFVVNKEATSKNLGLLKAINGGGVQKLNSGGEVLDIFGLRNIVNGFAEIMGEDINTSQMIDRIAPKIKKPKVKGSSMTLEQKRNAARQDPVFAHMQRNLVGGEGSVITGSQATEIFDEIARTGDLTPLERAYATALKPSGYKGSRITGNLGFDISSYLNSGRNSIDDLMQDLEWRRADGKNPYERMLLAAGVPKEEVAKVSENVHKRVSMRLKAMKRAGIDTFIDKDLYQSMEKIVPIAMKNSGLSDKTGNLFTASKISDAKAVRWGGITQAVFKAAKAAGVDIEHKGGKYFRVGDLTEGTKGVSVRGTSSSRGKLGGYAGPVLQLLSLLSGGIRRNSGGPVPGTGNTDTVPAMLTPGEFVVNKKAASQNQGILEMMNGGNVKGYALGGLVTGAASLANSRTGRIAGGAIGSIGGFSAGKALTGGNEIGGIIGSILAPMLPRVAAGLASAIGISTAAFTGIAAPLALAGFAIYKLNKSLDEARKSGAELSEAMYGSSKTVKAMADAFGRETNATALRRKAIEKAGGQEITPEAVTASGEFMKTEAASQIIKDLELVKKSGEDVALALRNQLASSIISGAITPEEAKAIAMDMGKAIGDEKVAIKVAGQLATLLGPNGEKITDNVIEITAEISPKINSQKIKNDAEEAYNSLNIAQKFGELFTGGKESFVEQFSIDKIAEENASALTKEAEARALLNLAYEEGTITLKEYLEQEGKISAGASIREDVVNNANAVAAGYKTYDEMIGKIQDTAKEIQNLEGAFVTPATIAAVEEQGANLADSIIPGSEEFRKYLEPAKAAYKQELQNSGFAPEAAQAMVDGIENNLTQTDVRIFDKFISGQIPDNGYDILIRLQAAGDLTAEDIDRIAKELTAINTIPNIDKIINFNSSDEDKLTELYDDLMALEEQPDVWKGINIQDGYSETLNQFGIDYAWLMSLPNTEKIVLLRNITTYEEVNKLADIEKSSGYVEGGTRQAQVAAGRSLIQSKEAIQGGTQDFTPQDNGGGGGGGKQSLSDYIKEFKEATKAKMDYFKATNSLLGTEKQEALALIDTAMYLKANKKQRAELIKLAEKQLNIQRATAFLSMTTEEKTLLSLSMQEKALDKISQKEEKALRAKQRQTELNNRALEDLAEKEDAVNEAYDARFEALDKVSEANDRIAEQDRSRISLASALASGDIAAAANAASEMQQQNAQYQIEDTRAALEEQRKKDIESLTVSVNGKLMTRNELEAANKAIQEEVEVIQDRMFNLETERLTLAEKRADAELRTFLLQQKQTIEALKLKEINKELTGAQKGYLKTLMVDFKNLSGVDYNQYKKYGGTIAKMAFGGVAYKGSTESPPALRMQYGSTVPGIGMTDKVPALLTPGEFVVRKSVAKQYGGFLNQLNGQVFPGIGGQNSIPTNNFLDGIGSPRYSIPDSSISDIPVNSTNVVSTSSPMYNSTYNVNVNVSGTNASPDDIANVVMAKLSQQNRGNLRSSRY